MTRSRDNATNVAGDISGVTAGTGLSGGGTDGTVTLNLSTPVASTNGGTGLSSFTTGDMIYSSSGNTLAKLGIGTTSQVLTVASGIPSWATAAGGNLTVSELSSGNFPAAAILTFSSLSSYDTLILFLQNVQFATQGSTVLARINNDSDANYNQFGHYFGDTANEVLQTNQTSIGLSNGLNVAYNENTRYMIKFYNCKAAGFTDYILHAFTRSNGNSNMHTFQGQFRKAAAVSSLVVTTGGGTNFNTGASFILMGG